jgi:hypothetical protein
MKNPTIVKFFKVVFILSGYSGFCQLVIRQDDQVTISKDIEIIGKKG